jgi:hypothetical protein
MHGEIAMKAAALRLLCLVALFAANDDRLWAQGPKDTDQRDRLIATILESQKSREVGAAYRALFRVVDRRGLHALVGHKNPGIAMQAAWELCLARVAVKDPRGNVQRFLGFVEGRTQLDVPLRWEVALVIRLVPLAPPDIDKALKDYLGVAPFLEKGPNGSVNFPAPEFRKSVLGLWAPSEITVKKENGKVVFSQGQASIFLEEEDLLQESRLGKSRERNYCMLTIGSDSSYLILYDLFGDQGSLLSLDTRTSKIRWRAQVMCMGAEKFARRTGSWYHEAILVPAGEDVAVFGIGSDGCYLEAFDRQTGRNSYRFATNLWYVGKE